MKYQVIHHQHIFFAENLPEFAQCHASTVAIMPDGRLASAWFGGDHEQAPNVAIWFSVWEKQSWSYPVKVADVQDIPCWNPVLMTYGDRVILFYKAGREIPAWQTMVKESLDCGRTWSEARELVPGDFGGRGPVRNKCLVLKDGTILAPASTEVEQEKVMPGQLAWNAFVDISDDGGKTWHRTDNVPVEPADFCNQGIIQPTLWEDGQGMVHMMLRSSEGSIFRSDSADGGRTWSRARRTQLPNNNSGIDVTRMDDGRLVLVYNPVSGNWATRTPIAFAVSEDNGKSWSEPQILDHSMEKSPEFSYPAVISRGNDLYITYTWKRRTVAFWQIRLAERERQ